MEDVKKKFHKSPQIGDMEHETWDLVMTKSFTKFSINFDVDTFVAWFQCTFTYQYYLEWTFPSYKLGQGAQMHKFENISHFWICSQSLHCWSYLKSSPNLPKKLYTRMTQLLTRVSNTPFAMEIPPPSYYVESPKVVKFHPCSHHF